MKFYTLFLATILSSTCLAGGVDDFNQKRYDAAFRALLPEAESGQAASMFFLGRIYFEGLGTAPRDTGKGISLISRSADKGYEPAIKFLANHYEKTGNIQSALSQYEKLKEKGDLSAVESIARLSEQSFSKDKKITPQYCSSLESLKILGKNFNEINYIACIVDGKIQGKTLRDGVGLLKQLADKPADPATIQLIPYLISKRNDPSWDPVLADVLIFKLYSSNSRLIEQLKNSVANSDINFELCRFTPLSSNIAEIKSRVAICRISALKGDQNALSYVLDRQLSGGDGFQIELDKASILIGLMQPSSQRNELSLKYYQLTNDVFSHLNLIKQEASKLDPVKLNDAMVFQFNNLIANSKRNIIRPSEFDSIFKVYIDYASCDLKGNLVKFIDSSYINQNGLILLEDEKLKISAVKSLLACQSLQQATPAVVAPPNAQVFLPLNPPSSLQTAPINNSQVVSTPIILNQAVSGDFSKLVENCDLKDSQSCVSAAKMIIDGAAMAQIKNESQRKNLAVGLLDKGSVLGNVDAKYALFDLLESFKLQTPAEMAKSAELLAYFESNKNDSASLRIAYTNINSYDPLKIIFGTLDGRLTEYCNQARLISVKQNLNASDRILVNKILSSPLCK